MPEQKDIYLLSRGERGVFAEIYFPKKGVYQGTIFDALKDGLDEEKVKIYLQESVPALLEELKDYYNLLNPLQYEQEARKNQKISLTPEEAVRRIDIYKSPFKGWSMNEVDGVWKDNDGIVEERTQVVKIIFRLPSAYTKEAIEAESFDVLRSILFWCISQQGNLDEYVLWNKSEQDRFITHHKYLKRSKNKLTFTKKYFVPIAKEADKWRDDCALFVFGYLVKKFAEKVIIEQTKEEEIWVASLFNLTLNIFNKTVQPTQP